MLASYLNITQEMPPKTKPQSLLPTMEAFDEYNRLQRAQALTGSELKGVIQRWMESKGNEKARLRSQMDKLK